MKKSLVMAVVMAALIPVGQGYAKSTSTSTGILLTNHTSVRAGAMGDAHTAVASDESGAEGWNPANLLGIPDPQITALYYSGLVDDKYGALNYAMPLDKNLACGANLVFYDGGTFELNSATDDTSSSVSAQRDYLATVTGAYNLNVLTGLAIGANIKFLSSTLLNEYKAFAIAADLGASMEVIKDLRVGLAVKNLGTPLKYFESSDPLPSSALVGMGYAIPLAPSFTALVAADAQYDLESTVRGNVGAEVKMFDMVSVRGGYKAGYDLGTFTLGLGFQMADVALDYAFTPSTALNSMHRVSLKYTFVTPKPEVDEESNTINAVAEEPYRPDVSDVVPKGPVERVGADLLEIQRMGGRVSKVILNVGSNDQIRVGYQGSIVDPEGRPLAGIIVRQVDPKLCLAEVIGLGKDFNESAKAVIERPIR